MWVNIDSMMKGRSCHRSPEIGLKNSDHLYSLSRPAEMQTHVGQPLQGRKHILTRVIAGPGLAPPTGFFDAFLKQKPNVRNHQQ